MARYDQDSNVSSDSSCLEKGCCFFDALVSLASIVALVITYPDKVALGVLGVIALVLIFFAGRWLMAKK